MLGNPGEASLLEILDLIGLIWSNWEGPLSYPPLCSRSTTLFRIGPGGSVMYIKVCAPTLNFLQEFYEAKNLVNEINESMSMKYLGGNFHSNKSFQLNVYRGIMNDYFFSYSAVEY